MLCYKRVYVYKFQPINYINGNQYKHISFFRLKKSILILLVLLSTRLLAQDQKLTMVLSYIDQSYNDSLITAEVYNDSISAMLKLKKLVANYRAKSYLLADYSVEWREDSILVDMLLGQKYHWVKLDKGNLSENDIRKVSFSGKKFNGQKIRFEQFSSFAERLIEFSENSGYPFAQVSLDSISIMKGALQARVKFHSGPLIVNDSIQLIGRLNVNRKFLSSYLEFEKGAKYNHSNYVLISKRLKSLRFVKVVREPLLTFHNGKANLVIFVEPRKANKLNGILGILPNTDVSKRVLITGEVNLDLLNPFGSGKRIKAEWKKIQPESQQLDMLYEHPNLIGTGINTKVQLNLLKQDSAFINIKRGLSLSHSIGAGSISFNTYLSTSRALGNRFFDSTTVPQYFDVNFLSQGLEYTWNNLDDIYYPKRGFMAQCLLSIGTKTITKNNRIAENHYSGLQLRSAQVFFEGHLERYFKMGKQTVLQLRTQGGIIKNKNIFLNDMFRIGGLNSLRGFNENNFFASGYGIGSVEFRVFTDETSYVMLFYDQAYYEQQSFSGQFSDWPLGIGAGISFSTQNGVFSFVYSLGNSSSQSLSFNLSRIHFGLVSNF